ncbi:replication initiation protein RepC, partial [Acidithiobacillus ferriphilus]
VTTLENRQADLRGRLEAAIDTLKEAALGGVESTNMNPKGLTDEPHITYTNQTLDPADHVSTLRKRSSTSGGAGTSAGGSTRTGRSGDGKEAGHRPTGSRAIKPEIPPDGTVFRMTPDELVRLAPRLRAYLAKSSPGWPEIVEAADWLRHDLGVSKPLWGDACLAMGREQAAVALAIVSTKPSDHFRGSPGGY